MGGTASSEKLEIPPLHYIHKLKSTAYIITPKRSSKIKLNVSFRLSQSCSIGYIEKSPFKILICGGKSQLDTFISTVLILDTVQGTTKTCANLPISSCKGYLFYYKNWVYYAGQTCKCEDDGREIPGQMMRYTIKYNYWEIIPDVLDFKENLEKNSGKPQKHTKISDIFNPTVVLHKGILYFTSGKIKNNKGQMQNNLKFFSVNLKKKDFRLLEEKFTLPYKVKAPACIDTEKGIILLGGTMNKVFSKKCIFMQITEEGLKFEKLPDLDSEFIDEHPHVFVNGNAIVFAFPQIFVLKKNAKNWEKVNLLEIKKSGSLSPARKKKPTEKKLGKNSSLTDLNAKRMRKQSPEMSARISRIKSEGKSKTSKKNSEKPPKVPPNPEIPLKISKKSTKKYSKPKSPNSSNSDSEEQKVNRIPSLQIKPSN